MIGNVITVTEYFGPYYGHAAITREIRDNVERLLLPTVNRLLGAANRGGVLIVENPATGTVVHSEVAGSGNGGWRPPDCAVGAPKSKHKRGLAVDIYDPRARLAAWCYGPGRAVLEQLGLTMERHEWTPTWVHLQCVPPGPLGAAWRLDFIPSSAPALCGPLAEQGRST